MIAYAADPTLTMANARDLYFDYNHFGKDGGYNDAWVDFKLGPIPFPFPNTSGRLRAVRFHDLHHVLTGYNTDFPGELEISAWELGAGCKDFYAAWNLNLGGAAAGMLFMPRRIWKAFLRGRQSRTVYGENYDALMGKSVGAMRTELGLDHAGEGKVRASDVALFVTYTAVGFVTGTMFLWLAAPAALVANVVAYFKRPKGGAAAGEAKG